VSEQAKGAARTNIRWDDSQVKSVYADMFRVTVSPGEIALLFGRKEPAEAWSKGEIVQLSHRILMSPFTAKRLAIALNNATQEYEVQYGPPGKKKPLSKAQEQLQALIQNPPFSNADKTPEKVGPLLQYIKDLDVEIGFERSFKMFDKTLLGKRFLLGIKKETIRHRPQEKILEMCAQMGMPADFLESYREQLPEANVVLFAFEENERACVCKAYLEFGSRFERAIKRNPHKPAPFPFHLGFKWDMADNTSRVITKYSCIPFLPVEAILERLSAILDPHRYGSTLEIAKDIVGMASNRVPHYDILYLDVTEDNNQRRSFDINMYRANLQLKELYTILSRMCRHYSIPPEEFQILYEPVKTEIFGHLAGGIDRAGRDFLTIYYGVEGYFIP
jgi:hypothetical protein